MAMFVSGSSTSTGSFGTVKGTKHAIFGSHPDMDDMWYRTLSLGGRPNSSTLATLGFDPGGTYKQGIDYNSGDGELSFWGHNGSTFIKSVAFVGGASIGASTLVVSGSKVGIGVATPLAMLQVSPTSGASDTECIRLLNDTHQAYMSLWRGGNEVGRIATAYTELSLYAGNGGGIRLMDDGGNVGIYVKDGGKVGIGTTNPGGIATQSTLEIRATAAFLGLTSTAGSNSSGIEFGDTDDGNIGQIHYFHGDNSMNFTTNTGVAMTLDSSQNVGIGTTAPQADLHVSGSSGKILMSDQGQVTLEMQTNDTSAIFNRVLGSTSTSDVNGAIFMSGQDAAGVVDFHVNYGGGNSGNNYNRRLHLTATSASFDNCNVGIGTTAPARMLHLRTASHAYLRLESTSPDEGAGAGQFWDILSLTVGTFKIENSDIAAVHILDDGTIYRYPSTNTAWDNSSDVRIKKNIVNLKGEGLSIVNQLRPVRFDYTDDFIEAENLKSRHQHSYGGFIANEVREVLPDIVTEATKEVGGETWDDFLSINETCFNSIMMASIQELSDKVDALEISNAELKAQISGSS